MTIMMMKMVELESHHHNIHHRESDHSKIHQLQNFYNNVIQNSRFPDDADDDDDADNESLMSVQPDYTSDDGAVGGVSHSMMRDKSDFITDDDDDEMNSIVSPQDFDDSGNFRGPGVKRRKIEVPKSKLKNKIRKIKRAQMKKLRASNIRKNVNTKQNDVHDSHINVISPDDYDDFGNYHGPGKKRSKLEVSENDLDGTLNRIKSRKIRKNLRQIDDEEVMKKDEHVHPKELYDNFKRYKSHLKSFYPDQFDENGSFIGSDAEKRYLGRIALQLSRSSGKGMKRQKPKKQKRKKTSIGKSRTVERDFIPYSENIVYEYYDDPNELCERLNLLVASQKAGNTNHDQEINSIIEELRERSIIN